MGIMPNHFHGMIIMLDETTAHGSAPRRPLGTVIATFKSAARKRVKGSDGLASPIWQITTST